MPFDPRAYRILLGTLVRSDLRRYLARRSGLLGGVLLLGFGMPAALRIASGVARGRLDLAVVLTGIFLFVALMPTIGAGAFADSRRSARLRPYPVSDATRIAALATAALLDLPLLLAVPPTLGAADAAGPRAALVLPILWFAAVAAGQAVAARAGVLPDQRQVREAVAALVPALAIAALALGVASPGHAASLRRQALPVLRAASVGIPPGLAARALRAAPLPAAGAAAGLLLWAAGLSLAAVRLSSRDSAPVLETSGRRRRSFRRWLPGPFGAVAGKEALQIAREPALRGGLGQGSLAVAASLVVVLQPPNGPVELAPLLGTGGFAILLLWALQLLGNPWGTDPGPTLWTFPTSRRAWLAGKNLVHGALGAGLTVGVVALVGTAARTTTLALLHFAGQGVVAVVVALALGNVAAPWLAHALVPRPGRIGGTTAGQSFGTGLALLGIGLAATTVAVQVWGPWAAAAGWALSVPVGAVAVRRRERAVAAALSE